MINMITISIMTIIMIFLAMFRPHCLSSNRQDRRARRVESNNRERRRMHELNHAFQVIVAIFLIVMLILMLLNKLSANIER